VSSGTGHDVKNKADEQRISQTLIPHKRRCLVDTASDLFFFCIIMSRMIREDPTTEAIAVNLGHSAAAMSCASLGKKDIHFLSSFVKEVKSQSVLMSGGSPLSVNEEKRKCQLTSSVSISIIRVPLASTMNDGAGEEFRVLRETRRRAYNLDYTVLYLLKCQTASANWKTLLLLLRI
jgi:hypothetical protein